MPQRGGKEGDDAIKRSSRCWPVEGPVCGVPIAIPGRFKRRWPISLPASRGLDICASRAPRSSTSNQAPGRQIYPLGRRSVASAVACAWEAENCAEGRAITLTYAAQAQQLGRSPRCRASFKGQTPPLFWCRRRILAPAILASAVFSSTQAMYGPTGSRPYTAGASGGAAEEQPGGGLSITPWQSPPPAGRGTQGPMRLAELLQAQQALLRLLRGQQRTGPQPAGQPGSLIGATRCGPTPGYRGTGQAQHARVARRPAAGQC